MLSASNFSSKGNVWLPGKRMGTSHGHNVRVMRAMLVAGEEVRHDSMVRADRMDIG
jgi:hypothetical protein